MFLFFRFCFKKHLLVTMNNIVALCHFCEQHGPSLMFTCEKVVPNRLENSLEFSGSLSSQDGVAAVQNEIPGCSIGSVTDTDMSSLGSFDSLTSGLAISSKENSKKTDLCQACRSLSEDDLGFVSHDKQAGASYVSRQHPSNPEIFRLVRQACVRSLSCEVCPGREGPIMFGDEQHGYVISYTFYVKDNMSRGGQRWYSIISIMVDRVFLVQSWPFLVGCINRVVDYLQKEALDTFNSESLQSRQPNSSFKAKVSNAVTPKNFRQQRGGGNSNARSLVALTGNKDIYQYLHTAFTWIMRACAQRLKETVVHGLPTDEEIVRAELIARGQRSGSMADENSDIRFPSLAALTPDGGSRPTTVFSSLRHMRDVLQPPLFRAIVWHLLIGNQVIWRGRDQELITSAVHVLKDVLPIGCVKILTSSDTYVNSYKANLLGLNEKVHIPNHVTNTEYYVLVDVLPRTTTSQRLNQIYPALFDSSQSSIRGVEFHMTSGCIIPEKGPSLLNNLEVVLANDNLSEEVVSQCLICLKQEWINKVKVLYKFTKIDNRDKEDTSKLLQNCLNCADEDVRLLKNWMTALSSQFKDELRQSALSHSTLI